jgi:hypothetical protein
MEHLTEYLQNGVSREVLQLLLIDDEVWKVFTAQAELSR